MEMSIPDLLLDVGVTMATCQDCKSHTSTDSGLPPCTLSQGSDKTKLTPSPHSSRSTSSRSHVSSSRSRCSMISADSCDSDCLSSLDEGEATWDALGRMNSVRRSNRFDKAQLVTVTLRKGSDGFGLELGGASPPIFVNVFGDAAISGIRVGDKLLEVNGCSVRGLGHQEAGKMISEGSCVTTLLVHTVKPAPTPNGQLVYSGWLLKKGGSGVTPRNWRRRWFVVRDDCIAYYYAAPSDTYPLGAIVLRNYTVSKACHDVKKPYSFKIVKGGGRSYYFCAESEAEMSRWAQVFAEAATLEGRESVHFSGTAHNVSLSALSIKDPDCHGFLHKQGRSIKTWRRRYCVLKEHQLFYYGKMTHTTAYGVMNLTGYELCRGKTKETKYYFQAIPPKREMRVYNFYAETEGDRQRWIEAICKSLTKEK